MQVKRAGAAAAMIGRHIYVVGGVEDGNVPTAAVERFDCVSFTEGLEEGGGGGGGGGCGDAHGAGAASASAKIWEVMAPMKEARTDFALASMGGKLYAISGDTSGTKTMTDKVEVYDPFTDAWTVLEGDAGRLHTARCFCR